MRIKKSDIEREAKKPRRKLPFAGFIDRLRRHPEIAYARRVALKQRLEKAGLSERLPSASGLVLVVSVLLTVILTLFALSHYYDEARSSISFLVVLLLIIWVFGFALVTFLVWLSFYTSLDLLIYKRKQNLEEVLPDFLQLSSSNIRAGMTIDQALWLAVRPRFGVLAKEIEEVAKRTVAGESLDDALRHFVKKYDSRVLERSMNILIEGIHAGGEIGDILNKIAENIQENNIMRKEMAANVMTYAIFISFATVVAGPFMFAIAFQLVSVIQEVFSRVDISAGTSTGFSLSVSPDVLSLPDFQIFAVVSLIVTSIFSAMIISVIKKGNVKSGVKYIPMFIAASVTLYFIISNLFSIMVRGFF